MPRNAAQCRAMPRNAAYGQISGKNSDEMSADLCSYSLFNAKEPDELLCFYSYFFSSYLVSLKNCWGSSKRTKNANPWLFGVEKQPPASSFSSDLSQVATPIHVNVS